MIVLPEALILHRAWNREPNLGEIEAGEETCSGNVCMAGEYPGSLT